MKLIISDNTFEKADAYVTAKEMKEITDLICYWGANWMEDKCICELNHRVYYGCTCQGGVK